MAECPKCFLPKEESAWQCDGCGYTFRRDFDAVRSELQVQLRANRVALGVTLLVDLAIVGVIVFLATQGWLFFSVPLVIAVIGSIGHAAYKVSLVRGHLRALDRRHTPLPKAVASIAAAKSERVDPTA